MHAVGIWCKTKIQIDPGGLEVNFSLQDGNKRTVPAPKLCFFSLFNGMIG